MVKMQQATIMLDTKITTNKTTSLDLKKMGL